MACPAVNMEEHAIIYCLCNESILSVLDTMYTDWRKTLFPSSDHQILTVDEGDKDDWEVQADINEENIQAQEFSKYGQNVSLGAWKYLLQAGLFFTAIFITWKLATPSSTNLHNEVLTSDGKSFPLGQLTWSQDFVPLPCGNTPSEALSKGCHFDIIATAWLPPRCIDVELAVEFVALHPWQYFSNRNGTDPFPDDADTLGMQTGPIWTTDRWHAAHCLYMWKKLNRAIVDGWMTDAETVSQSHTNHCVMNIMNMKDPDAIRGVMEVIYPPC